jgi:hypothetical protein
MDLAAGGAANRWQRAQSIAAAGAIPLLVELLRGGSENGKEAGRQVAAGALWNLADGGIKVTTAAMIVAAGALPLLGRPRRSIF